MKPTAKEFTALIIILVVAGLLTYLLIQFWTPLKPMVRHVNPAAEAEQPPLPTFLTLLVTDVFDSLISGDYKAVAEGLKTLGAAYIPERYRFIADRFMQLLNDASSLLKDSGSLMDQAESLIMLGRGEEAKQLLHEASGKLTSANTTCIELRSACRELAKTFNLPMAELSRRVDELSMVIMKLYWRLLRLLEMIEKQTRLEDSYLTINVTPKTVWTGGGIEVSGRLYTANTSLNGRIVQIYVDGVRLAKAVTNGDGEFHVWVSLPYIYKPKTLVQARYMPEDIDSEVYKPSTSNTVEVSLLYIKPTIRAEIVGEILPGKTFILKGSVEAERPPPYSAVKISWAGVGLTVSLKNGFFNTTLYTPGNIPDGEYSLKVEAPAWQVFAPVELRVKVTVQRLPLNVTLQPPTIILAGSTSTLSGKLHSHEGFNITVKAVFTGQAYTTRSSREFSLDLSAPLTVFSGYQNYEIYVSPDPPWYRSIALKGSILVINPFTVLLPIGLVSALTLKLSRRGKVKRVEREEGFQQREAPVKTYSVASGLEWIIDMYWQAVFIVSRLTGVEMKPSMTMQEYLEAAGYKLSGFKDWFKDLTIAAEKALYSPAISAGEIESARRALDELKAAYVEAQL